MIRPPESRPAWGAWIEIEEPKGRHAEDASRPAWGAWIEILSKHSGTAKSAVAPRMGRVD